MAVRYAMVGDDEKALGQAMAQYWMNFARTSNPNEAPGNHGGNRGSIAGKNATMTFVCWW